MFVKFLKLHELEIMAHKILCPKQSVYLFIFSAQITIVEREKLLQAVRIYRKQHSESFSYHMQNQVPVFQSIRIPLDDLVCFDHKIYESQSSKPNYRNTNKRLSELNYSTIDGQESSSTEMLWVYSQPKSSIFVKSCQFECALEIIHKRGCSKAYGKLHPKNSQLYFIQDEILQIINIKAGKSFSYEIVEEINLHNQKYNIRYFSFEPLTFYSEQGIMKSVQDFEMQITHEFNFIGNKDGHEESLLIQEEEIIFKDYNDCQLFAFFQPTQKVYTMSSGDLKYLRMFKGVKTMSISCWKYVQYPQNTPSANELKKHDFSKLQPYRILALSINAGGNRIYRGKKDKLENYFSLLIVDEQGQVLSVLSDFQYEISSLEFISPYDIVFVDSAGHLGLFSLPLKEIGLVCQ